MARPLRIQYPGALCHVTCRGNEQKDIYQDDADRRRFLQLLSQSLPIYTVKLYSYILMANHFHLLLETLLVNLAEFMRHFNITYTSDYNRRHQRVGHLHQDRYQSLLVEKDSYLSVLSRYLHLNPVRIKTLERAPPKEKIRHLLQYPWSSLPGYLSQRKEHWSSASTAETGVSTRKTFYPRSGRGERSKSESSARVSWVGKHSLPG